MATPVEPEASEAATNPSADELEADIARTREQLGETVDALSQKFDVKAQVRLKVEKLNRGKPKAAVLAGSVLVVAAVGAGVVWRRRR